MLNNFICASKEYNTLEKNIPAPYFRKCFEINGAVDFAELIISALGFYEVYINGKNITKGMLAPYRSNPNHYIYYDKYCIKDYLVRGKNVIAVILGNGMQNSLAIHWKYNEFSWRSAPKLSFDVNIKLKDGENLSFESDESVLTANSPIIFDDLHYGEYYDARYEIEDWNNIDFDDADWSNAFITDLPKGEVVLCTAEPIVAREETKPVSILPFENGYIYDFGYNDAGVCRLHIRGIEGQKIALKHFETFVDSKPYYDNIRFNDTENFQEDRYICSGKGVETFLPRFTYHGFRYVYVEGISAEQATEELLTFVKFGSDIKQIGHFYCDNEIINKIQEATCRSDLANFYYFPTDCPHREKNGWTADASLSAEQMLLNFTPEKSYKVWLRNIYKSMTGEGKLPGIIPTEKWGYEWGNGPGWDNVIVNLPYYTYIFRNDLEILNDAAEPINKYLGYLYSKLDERNLISIGLGDWCQPSRREDNYSTPLLVTDSILVTDIAKKASYIFSVLKMQEYKEYADDLYARVAQGIKKHLIEHKSCIVYGDTQTAQAMALYYGMFEKAEKEKAVGHLVDLIHQSNDHLDVGVLGGRVIFRVLADNGYAELAYKMITRPDYPSYGNWIARGATTLWEGFWEEGKGKILSMNHHFWGDVSAWFYIYLAGLNINPSLNDFTKILIKPHFLNELNFVVAKYHHMYGCIKISWKKINGEIIIELEIPKLISAIIELPYSFKFLDGSTKKYNISGSYRIIAISNW